MNSLVKGRVLHTITGYNFKQDLGQVFGRMIKNGPHVDLIEIFPSDQSQKRKFCIPFNNLMNLTSLTVLLEIQISLSLPLTGLLRI